MDSDCKKKSFFGKGSVGFRFTEIMSGTHEFEAGLGEPGPHPFIFEVEWGPDEIKSWINPWNPDFMKQPLRGKVHAGGITESAPVEGMLELKYFQNRSIKYSFDFEASGITYSYTGEKVNIKAWNLPFSHTTCFGSLKEKNSGILISRSVTYFRMKTLPSFILGFRPVFR